MPSIYLSAAAHATDNPTKCPQACGENIHCSAYMDIVERRLKELGWKVKRGYKEYVGSGAMAKRVAEANAWGADIYYVAHTNAGGGRYSMTMCWPSAASKELAQVLHKHRKCVASHKVRTRRDLYEIKATAMPCLYDELFFHDNAEDCAWFHKGGMEQLAEETVAALCEMKNVKYVAPVEKAEPDAPNAILEWQLAAIADGYKFPKYGADGQWGNECAAVAQKAVCKKLAVGYKNKNLTKLVQRAVGVTADGLFGADTRAAVIAYQKAHGLAADGCVGLNTWKCILGVKG